jgi:UDP-GlcNAc3NAcA epimerase
VDNLSLIKNAQRVLTDSGGVQKESFFFNVPVEILRAESECSQDDDFGDGHAAEKIAKYLAHN